MLLERYPKEVQLSDGGAVTLRPLVRMDEEAMLDFFAGLTDADRLYLRNDVSTPGVIKDWIKNIDYRRVLPIRSEERRVGKECRSRWSPYH